MTAPIIDGRLAPVSAAGDMLGESSRATLKKDVDEDVCHGLSLPTKRVDLHVCQIAAVISQQQTAPCDQDRSRSQTFRPTTLVRIRGESKSSCGRSCASSADTIR